MLARLTRFLIALVISSWVAIGFALGSYSPIWAVLSLFGVGLIFSLTLAVQCTSAVIVNRHDSVPRASVRQLLSAWLKETWVAAKVFLWWQPFRSQQYPDAFSGNATGNCSRGVILVHGFICNRGVWNAWYPHLLEKQIPYMAINVEPVIASIDSYGDLLGDAVRRMHAATGKPPMLICHSMGGLAARAWLRTTNDDAHIHRVVTIGSPHAGTRVGNWAPQWPLLTNLHQMRSGARWLQSLAQAEPRVRRSKFVCFFSNCDNIVFPATSARLDGADNRHVAGIPHLALVLDKHVMEETLALL